MPAPELRPRAPGTIPEPEGVDLDLLALEHDRAHVAARLVEVGLARDSWGRDGGEREVDVDGLSVARASGSS